MPNTKRRFREESEDEVEDDSSGGDFEEEPAPRAGGGKQLHLMGRGKQLMRPDENDDDEEEDDEDSDDEEDSEEAVYRGGGKQFHPGGGKQLHQPNQLESDDDDEEMEEDEDDEPVRPVHRGGKSLLRMRPPEEEESDESELEAEAEDGPPVQSIARGGGKSFARMRPPVEEEDDDDDDEPPPVRVQPVARGGGKSLARMRPPPAVEVEAEHDKDPTATKEAEVPSKDPEPPAKPASVGDMDVDSEEEEKPIPKPPPKPTRSTRGRTKKKTEKIDESEDDSDDEMEMEALDPQSLVVDDDDRKYLESLPEFEREAILGERFEKLKNAADMKKALRDQKRKVREEVKQSAKKRKKTTPKAKKADTSRDAALATKLSSKRQSGRNRDATGTKAEKAKVRAQIREERQAKFDEMDEEEDDELDYGSDEDSDEDYEEMAPWKKKKEAKSKLAPLDREDESSGVSDMDLSDEEGKKALVSGPAVEAELDDYIKVTLPRRRLGRWVNEPFFEKAIMGCFVRLFVGETDDGKKCYRLCEIVGVKKSKSEYMFPKTAGQKQPISTYKILTLKFGTNQKEFPMYLISDSRPTDEDVRKYVSAQKTARQSVLGKKEASRTRRYQDELVHNYTYTKEDIEQTLADRKKKGKALANLGLEQTRAAIAVQAAKSSAVDARRRLDDAKKTLLEFSGDEKDIDDLKESVEIAEKELNDAKTELQAKKDEEKSILDKVEARKRKLTKRRKDQNWAKVNERAAQMNQNADFESYKAQQAREQAEATSAPKFNPYARRKVKPKILWEVGQKEEKKDDDATASKDTEVREEVDKANDATVQHAVLTSHKSSHIGESHEFNIDEEVLARNGSDSKPHKLSGTRVRKGLSLAEYLERKASGTL